MGEAVEPKKTALALASEDMMVAQTMGGRIHVRWDETAQATPHGQIVYFAEFLATAGVFDRWVEACPLCGDRTDLFASRLRASVRKPLSARKGGQPPSVGQSSAGVRRNVISHARFNKPPPRPQPCANKR
jgi:hypothetical protein